MVCRRNVCRRNVLSSKRLYSLQMMDDGGCPGPLQTGLTLREIGRPSGLPDAPTPVRPQCSCVTDFTSEIHRPYYRL